MGKAARYKKTGPTVATAERKSRQPARLAALTSREREIITLVCEGASNREIGKRLCISPVTVRHHLSSIYRKLCVRSRVEFVIYVFRQRLTEVNA